MKKRVWVIAVLGTVAALSTAHAYEVTAVSDGGELVGKVTFKGTVPEPRKMAVAKDPSVCGAGIREIVEVAVKDGALQNVVVYVAKVDKGKAWSDPAKPVLNQQGCRFAPEVLLVKKEEDLTIRNSDPVLHNIHTYEIIGNVRRTMFNVGQPDKGDIRQPVKLRRASIIKIECDAHDFMHGWAFAIENPYADVSKADGSFKIDALPPGDYEVKAWHPVLGERSTKISVKPGAPASVAFEFSK
ncbi:carboxypeptidase regulatory-like domain-containing protein [Bradyrhizobium sp.]|uniref:carboxypeptidase regulatory-like domain-containing protein n=1 Tax=Bradyrhizobium sp. TaxID=376 RepID=UPI0040376115